jgi:hypothetical protein
MITVVGLDGGDCGDEFQMRQNHNDGAIPPYYQVLRQLGWARKRKETSTVKQFSCSRDLYIEVGV